MYISFCYRQVVYVIKNSLKTLFQLLRASSDIRRAEVSATFEEAEAYDNARDSANGSGQSSQNSGGQSQDNFIHSNSHYANICSIGGPT